MAIPNTTPTPNELYNGEMAKMTDTELRIVLITTRATLGWEIDKETKMRKQEDWISHYQLIKKSGRSSRSITKAIDNCVKMGWIEIRDKNGELLNTKNKRVGNKMYFRLGRLFLDKIQTPAESKEVEVDNPQTPAESKEVEVDNPQTPAESKIEESKAYKRNTIQNNNAGINPAFKEIIDYFSKSVEKSFDYKPKIDGADGARLKWALNNYPPKDIENMIDFYLKNKAEKNGITLKAVFSTHSINFYEQKGRLNWFL